MNHKALVVIDIQNDITKHYQDIMDRLNAAIECHPAGDMPSAVRVWGEKHFRRLQDIR